VTDATFDSLAYHREFWNELGGAGRQVRQEGGGEGLHDRNEEVRAPQRPAGAHWRERTQLGCHSENGRAEGGFV
jgi:hypothetical protein